MTENVWSPTAYDFIKEAFERIGLNEEALSYDHYQSALTSLKFIQAEFATQKAYLPSIIELPDTPECYTTDGVNYIDLPVGLFDIISLAIEYDDDRPVVLRPMTFEDWNTYTLKDERNRPTLYFYPKGAEGTNSRRVFFNFTPDNSYRIYGQCQVQPEDIVPASQIQTAYRWYNAFATKLALRLAEKYNPERYEFLLADWREAHSIAVRADMTRNPIRFKPPSILS